MTETIRAERLYAVTAKLVTLAEQCVQVINTHPRDVQFVVLIGKLPAKGWPRGKCLGSDSRGKFYAYDAVKLLAKLVVMGVIKVEARVREDS